MTLNSIIYEFKFLKVLIVQFSNILVPELDELSSPFVSSSSVTNKLQKEQLLYTSNTSLPTTSGSSIAFLTPKANSKRAAHQPTIKGDNHHQTNNNNNNNNNLSNMNRVLRSTQSELTLPPILESQVSTPYHGKHAGQSSSSNGPPSANKRNSRIDSGIVADMPGNKANLTVSTNGSEQDYDVKATVKAAKFQGGSNLNENHTLITTIELVEANNQTVTGIMRKSTAAGGSASALNGYGNTSPATQAKLNQNGGNVTARKISIQIPTKSVTKQQLMNSAAAATNETKYVDLCEKLNSLNEVNNNYFLKSSSNNNDKSSNKRPNLDR